MHKYVKIKTTKPRKGFSKPLFSGTAPCVNANPLECLLVLHPSVSSPINQDTDTGVIRTRGGKHIYTQNKLLGRNTYLLESEDFPSFLYFTL